MKKPPSLRAALTAALDDRHHISQDADRMLMVAVDGRLMVSGRPGMGYQKAYTLQISLMDFAGDPTEVEVPLLLWLQRWQNDLVSSAEAAAKGVTMTYEFLEHGKYDIHVDLQLTELVAFSPRPGGGHDVVFLEEPAPMFALEGGEPLHALYLYGELLMHCQAHPDAGGD